MESHWFVWVSQSNHIPMEIEEDRRLPWFRMQLQATCDVQKGAFNDWFTGHLNFQIEHQSVQSLSLSLSLSLCVCVCVCVIPPTSTSRSSTTQFSISQCVVCVCSEVEVPDCSAPHISTCRQNTRFFWPRASRTSGLMEPCTCCRGVKTDPHPQPIHYRL